MTRPTFWTPQTAAWSLALAGAFVVFVSGGCGLIQKAVRNARESRRPVELPPMNATPPTSHLAQPAKP